MVREYADSDAQRVVAALLDKYGQPLVQPTANPEMTARLFSIKATDRALWRDRACALDIELMKSHEILENDRRRAAMKDAVAIVVTAASDDPSKASSFLP